MIQSYRYNFKIFFKFFAVEWVSTTEYVTGELYYLKLINLKMSKCEARKVSKKNVWIHTERPENWQTCMCDLVIFYKEARKEPLYVCITLNSLFTPVNVGEQYNWIENDFFPYDLTSIKIILCY